MRWIGLMVVITACGSDSPPCDEPPAGGFYEIVLVSGDETLCDLATDPAVNHAGTLETFCRGCDETYGLDADGVAWASGVLASDPFGNEIRVEVEGACGDDFAATIKTWQVEPCFVGRPRMRCPLEPSCVYSLRMDR